VISLPQTLHYSSRAGLEGFAALAGKHKDLHLFWRDRISYEIARRHFDCRNYLCPDMAHYLWPIAEAPSNDREEGDLFLIRRDKEAGVIPQWVLTHRDAFVDWRELMPGHYRLLRRPVRVLDMAGGITGMRSPALTVWVWGMRRLLPTLSAIFRNYDRIVTSRLHAHIFACLVGTPSVLIDNSYGKNRTYFDAWTGALGLAEFAAPEPATVGATVTLESSRASA
jgi:pyruvyl transferase EpsO